MISERAWARVGVVGAVLFALVGGAHAGDEAGLRVGAGRLTASGAAAETGATLRPGLVYEVPGGREALLQGPGGLSLRAMPGSRFQVLGVEPTRATLRLDAGVISDARSEQGTLDIATPAGTLRGDHAVLFARVAARNVYVEHQTGSTGTAGLFSSGSAVVPLAAGTFRMMALDAGDNPSPVRARDFTPVPTPAPVATAAAPAATGATPVVRSTSQPPAAEPLVPYDPSCPPNPCSEPPPCAPPPPPCAPPPVCGGCGELIRHSGVPVPVRADDTGRSPLGSALGGDACNPVNSVCACKCGKIPYVHYVEGLECDVSTYRVGNCLVTVRPASRVRVHRLPDGSLQLWGPNLGRDLALIEIQDNQFCYIGDDGFLVIGCDCQIQYFRGLVHLYSHPDRPYRDENPPREQEKSGDRITEQSATARGNR